MHNKLLSHLPFSPDTPSSQSLFFILIALWILGAISTQAEFMLALIPGNTLSNYFLWTFITSGFFENSFFMGAINIAVYVCVAASLEKSWGTWGFIKFILIVNVCTMVSLFFSMVACYAFTEYEPCLYRAVCGFSGLNAAFAVALKQQHGEKSCVQVPVIEFLKFKHLPMILGWTALCLWLIGHLGGKECPLIFFGTFYAWIYLRFFRQDEADGTIGDMRAEMSLASLFPDIGGLRALIEFLGTVVFQTLLRLGLFADLAKSQASLPTSQHSHSTNPQQHHHVTTTTINHTISPEAVFKPIDPTAERRRLLAIKAIDDKLAELSRQPSAFPTDASATTNNTAQPLPVSLNELPSEEDLAKLEQQLSSNSK